MSNETSPPATPAPNGTYEELSASECWSLLRDTFVGRIAMRGDGDDVDIFPINFMVDHGSIVFRTAAGTKLEGVIAERRITFEADHWTLSDGVAWSVIAKGPADRIRAHRDLLDAFDLDVNPWHAGTKPTFVRVVPEEMTGRRFTIDPSVMAKMTNDPGQG